MGGIQGIRRKEQSRQMAYKRRRRAKYTWFPQFGEHLSSESPGGDDHTCILSSRVQLDNDNMRYNAVPLTVDHQLQASTGFSEDTELADIMGNEWFLRRIVGNLHITAQAAEVTDNGILGSATFPPNVWVAAGFFVAKAGLDNDSLPLGYADADSNKLYNPLHVDGVRQPWIWRRRWTLGVLYMGTNGASTALPLANRRASFPGELGNPQTNIASYQDAKSSGQIDQKTLRRIRQDNRLFFAIGAMPAVWDTPTAAYTGVVNISWSLDYRLLGQLRRPRNRGTF